MQDSVKFGSFRVDYLKFKVALPIEEVKKWKDVFLAVFDDANISRGEQHTADVASVKRTETGDYLYAFEVWGESCLNVVDLPLEQWMPHLDRVDIRRECDVTQAGLDNAYAFLRDHTGDRRQVNQFSTPPRAKRGGRHGGGIGIQVGSHKSDFRVIVYRKPSEMGAIEVNLSGDLLKDIKDTARMLRRDGNFQWAGMPWRNLISACEVRCRAKVDFACGIPLEELADLASGRAIPSLTEEQRLAEVDEHLENLTLTGLSAIYETLQMKLFPYEATREA